MSYFLFSFICFTSCRPWCMSGLVLVMIYEQKREVFFMGSGQHFSLKDPLFYFVTIKENSSSPRVIVENLRLTPTLNTTFPRYLCSETVSQHQLRTIMAPLQIQGLPYIIDKIIWYSSTTRCGKHTQRHIATMLVQNMLEATIQIPYQKFWYRISFYCTKYMWHVAAIVQEYQHFYAGYIKSLQITTSLPSIHPSTDTNCRRELLRLN